MSTLNTYVDQATDLKKRGLSDSEIARELKVSLHTVEWLLAQDIRGDEQPPADVKVGWRSIGVSPARGRLIAEVMVDIIDEELVKEETPLKEKLGLCVVGIAQDGVLFATFVAEMLGCDLVVYRPDKHTSSGVFGMNYASVADKNVIIVDDVFGTGRTMRGALKAVKDTGGNPVLVMELINKTEHDAVDGVPLRGIIRTHVVR